ncbi:MAG: hypothetical protein NXH85_09615 [Pseudomonadaceae bacterium]|nr:hypothetical protein [Pseudomonadaceae bacterium]
MRQRKLQTIALGLSLLASSCFVSAGALADESPLFETTDTLEITLTADWRAIVKDKAQKPREHPAQLQAESQTYDVTVKARGKSRRLEFCRFPPLWLDLPRKQMQDSVFAGQNRLKLVTHCSRLGRPDARSEDVLAAEFLVYQMLSHMTDTSFRSRWLSISYVDTDGTISVHPGFVIEHKRRLGERLQLTEVKSNRIGLSRIDPAHASLMAVFNYMIGNVDFSILAGPPNDDCCHNVVPMADAGPKPNVFPVAYDFDSTGLVDPSYGRVPDGLGITRLTQRLFRGYCRHSDELPSAIARFVDARPGLERLIADSPGLSDRKRSKIAAFVAGFYKRIGSEKAIERDMIRRCR